MTEWFSFHNTQEQFEGVRGNDIKTILQTLKFSKGLSRWQIKKKKEKKRGQLDWSQVQKAKRKIWDLKSASWRWTENTDDKKTLRKDNW